VKPTLEQGPGSTCGPMDREAHAGAGLLAGLVTSRGVPEGLHPVKRTHTGAIHKELQPVGKTHFGAVCGELSPVGGTSRWSRGGVSGVLPLRRKEWQRQRAMNWPSPADKEKVEKLGVKLSPGRREGWGKDVFRFVFCFSSAYSDLIGNKLNSFSPSRACFACEGNC